MRVSGAWQVRAGILPGQPMTEYDKTFTYTAKLREEDEEAEKRPNPYARLSHYMRLQGEAQQYFRQLNDPRILNWAELTWIWY